MTYNPVPPDHQTNSSYTEMEGGRPPQTTPSGQRVPVSMPSTRPMVTYTMLGIIVLIFLLQLASQFFSQSLYGIDADLLSLLGRKENGLILQGQYWRLFTPMLLHGSILHLGFNMYALYIFGPGLERHYGHARFLALFILSGFAGNVLSFMFSVPPSLGSSTAIFGLLGAEGVFLYRNQHLFGGSARRALNNIILIAIVNFIFSYMAPGIDIWGHLGGLIGGTLFAWFAGPILGIQGEYPDLRVVDTRPTRQVVLAGVVDALIFAFLAVLTIALRSS